MFVQQLKKKQKENKNNTKKAIKQTKQTSRTRETETERERKTIYIPLQVLPSPEYPALHLQVYDPRMLLQTALTSQLWELVEHSSISTIRLIKYLNFTNKFAMSLA